MTDRMGDVDHTHPQTDEALGEAFQPGPHVAADGGERDAPADLDATDVASGEGSSATNDETSSAPVDHEPAGTMDDVDHTSATAVDRSFERGGEERSDGV